MDIRYPELMHEECPKVPWPSTGCLSVVTRMLACLLACLLACISLARSASMRTMLACMLAYVAAWLCACRLALACSLACLPAFLLPSDACVLACLHGCPAVFVCGYGWLMYVRMWVWMANVCWFLCCLQSCGLCAKATFSPTTPVPTIEGS